MAKAFIAQNIVSVNPLQFTKDSDGNVIDLLVNCEVNYGELGLSHQVSLWSDLTAAEKMKAQAVYNKIAQLISNHFLGGD